MGKFMIIFPCQITAEQMGFSFEFLVARIIFALGRTFQNLEKPPKIYLPSIPYINAQIQTHTVRPQFFLFSNVGGHMSFYGSWISLFWTSGDVSSRFQSQTLFTLSGDICVVLCSEGLNSVLIVFGN